MGAIAGGGSGRRFTAEFVTQKMQERFASLEDEAKRKAAFEKLTSGQVSAFLAEAPVNIVVCGRKDVWDLPYDTSAAIENMLLMVTALGRGACWVIAPCIDIRDEQRLKDLLGVPEGLKIVSIIAVGHPARYPRPRPRIPLHELVYREKWGNPYYEKKEECWPPDTLPERPGKPFPRRHCATRRRPRPEAFGPEASGRGGFSARGLRPEGSARRALAPRRAPAGGEAISRGRVGDCFGRSAPSQ